MSTEFKAGDVVMANLAYVSAPPFACIIVMTGPLFGFRAIDNLGYPCGDVVPINRDVPERRAVELRAAYALYRLSE